MSKLCGERIIFSLKQTHFIGKLHCIRSSLFTLKRNNIHYSSIIKSFQNNSYYNHHHIVSFCTQSKQHKDEQNDIDEQTVTNDDDDDENEEYEDDEYEDEEEEEEEEEEEDEDEYEYEYETDEEFEEEEDENDEERSDDIKMEQESSEISENFDFMAYSENVMNELFINLPETGRIDGKPVEHFISPLILKPLEVLDDDIHNKFILMHNDMNNLWKEAYKIPIENESELRDIIDLAFDKLNIYTFYIENNFDLRHSPKHYLMRQLRKDHGSIVFLSIRKIMYFKYPQWVQSDNWAKDEMSDDKKRKFIISEKLGIGLENLQNIDNELDKSSIVDEVEQQHTNLQTQNMENNDIEIDEQQEKQLTQ